MAECPRKRDTEKEGGDEAMCHREPGVPLPTEIGIKAKDEADDNAVDTITV